MGNRKLNKRRRDYLRIKASERRREIRQKAVEYLGGRCSECGYIKCIASLDFHHKNSLDKEFQLSDGNIRRWESIKKELDKCVLLCKCCHAELHYLESTKKFEQRKREWYASSKQQGSINVRCDSCGKVISKFSSQKRKTNFCSQDCKQRFDRKDWPDDSVLVKMFQTMSVKDICAIIGKSNSRVYQEKKRLFNLGLLS